MLAQSKIKVLLTDKAFIKSDLDGFFLVIIATRYEQHLKDLARILSTLIKIHINFENSKVMIDKKAIKKLYTAWHH